MSAIFGIINLDGTRINNTQIETMVQEYKGFKIDRFKSITQGNAAFGTGQIYVRKQAENEILPYYDETNHILFTTDCYLDNRNDLIPSLKEAGISIGITVNEDTPDGMLVYLSYLKWGADLCSHLLGVFAIAIYEYDNNQFHLYIDHCGERCVHYYMHDNTIFFSTTLRPIQAATDFSINVSEKYIAACESDLSPDMVLFLGLTPYEDVYQLLASQHLTASFSDKKASYKIHQYWDPIKTVKKLTLPSDEDYKKLFLETYSKCVSDTLDVNGKIGTFLSSGLDSSSVAALASIALKKDGKNLHSYTSCPIKEFEVTNNQRLEDESASVKEFCKYFDNIIPSFVSCEGKSALTELERFVRLFNSPIKFCINAIWLDEIFKRASDDGCKILLRGQHGNTSISYGKITTRLWYEFKNLHFKTMIKQYRAFSGNTHIFIHKKALLKELFSELLSYIHPKTQLEYAMTRKELLKKYKIKQEFIRRRRWYGEGNIHSNLHRRRCVYMPASFQQVSFANAHFELQYGVITRDPTKDKRIIELCLSLPISSFADGAYERRLITDYMKEILPSHTRHQIYKRGVQSADHMLRMKLFPDNRSIFHKMLSDNMLYKYIDKETLRNLKFDDNNNINMLSSLYVLSLAFFLNQKKL